MTCPWDSWEPTGLYFCEASLCAWVKQPGNSWSNTAYLAVGLYLWVRWRKTHSEMARQLLTVSALIGVGSFFLHSSLTFTGEIADLFGMFLLAGLGLLWNVERYRRAPVPSFTVWFFALALTPAVLMGFFGSVGIRLFGAMVVGCLLLEIKLWRQGDGARYRFLASSGAIFTVAYSLWWLDVHKAWCQPHNHLISGHILWHALTAICLVPLAKFYEPFRR